MCFLDDIGAVPDAHGFLFDICRDIPFLLGNASSRSFSVIGNVQDAIRQCDTTYVVPGLNGFSPASTTMNSKTQRTVDRHEASAQSVTSSILQGGGEFTRDINGNATPGSTKPRNGSAGFKKNKPDAIKMPPNPRDVNPFVSPMQVRRRQPKCLDASGLTLMCNGKRLRLWRTLDLRSRQQSANSTS